MRAYILSEIQKAWIWYKRTVSIFAQWIFQMFIRLMIAGVIAFFLGGGCFLRSYLSGKKEPDKEASSFQQMHRAEGNYMPTPGPVYHEREVNLQSQVRDGQSQVRSWDYTVRSIKNDIEYLFRKR